MREGLGTEVEQEAGTENWFQFAVPTLSEQEDTGLAVVRGLLRIDRVQGDRHDLQVIVDRVDIGDGNMPLDGYGQNEMPGNWNNQVHAFAVRNPRGAVQYGVVISVHAFWVVGGEGRGASRLRLISAGAQFQEV
jgi:hypothetical protein